MPYAECKDTSSMLVSQGELGGGITCKGMKTTMGLYFPNGYNGTLTNAYDFYRKEFYPCTQINEDYYVTTYACGGVQVDFAPDEPVTSTASTTSTTSTPVTTAVATSTAVTVNTTTVVPSTVVTTVVATSTTARSTVSTTIATPSPTSSCAAGAYGRKRGQGNPGQCCKTDDDCHQNCKNG
ncbi:hypothetical protein BGZ80_006276, partial [Entomortierella chlamydospora]